VAQVDAIRLKLLKIGAVVRLGARRVWLQMSSAYSWKEVCERAWAALRCRQAAHPHDNCESNPRSPRPGRAAPESQAEYLRNQASGQAESTEGGEQYEPDIERPMRKDGS
jgi:hypothetical protein